MDEDLSNLLDRAAVGDHEAFLRFYDLTIDRVFGYELARARLHLRRAARGAADERTLAATATVERYVRAWAAAAEQPASGLTPGAWLLSPPDSASGRPEAACA